MLFSRRCVGQKYEERYAFRKLDTFSNLWTYNNCMFSLQPQSSCLGKTAPNQTHNGKFHPVPPYKVHPLCPSAEFKQYIQNRGISRPYFFIYYGISNIFFRGYDLTLYITLYESTAIILKLEGGETTTDVCWCLILENQIRYLYLCIFFKPEQKTRCFFAHDISIPFPEKCPPRKFFTGNGGTVAC